MTHRPMAVLWGSNRFEHKQSEKPEKVLNRTNSNFEQTKKLKPKHTQNWIWKCSNLNDAISDTRRTCSKVQKRRCRTICDKFKAWKAHSAHLHVKIPQIGRKSRYRSQQVANRKLRSTRHLWQYPASGHLNRSERFFRLNQKPMVVYRRAWNTCNPMPKFSPLWRIAPNHS